ncbi:MAG: sulfite exporter TauE/SafE family protein [Alphaproteobacteria bacterium]
MDLLIFVLVGAVVAGFVQGLSGFAFALVAMSVWAWVLEPAVAAVLTVFGAAAGQVIAAPAIRRGFDRHIVLPFVAGGILGIPLGVLVLPLLDPQIFKFLLGLFLMLWCPAMLASARLPTVRAGGRAADGLIGVAGGVMGGIGGFSGPVPTLWITLRGYPKEVQRAAIQSFNLAVLTLTFAAYVATGLVTVEILPLFGVVALAMVIPVWLGTRLYIGIAEATFRRIVLGLLAVSGAGMVAASAGPVFSRLG